jgi:hypothetical protein
VVTVEVAQQRESESPLVASLELPVEESTEDWREKKSICGLYRKKPVFLATD